MAKHNHPVLIVIDVQNDYFPQGKSPQWNTAKVLENIKTAIDKAHQASIPVILVQHIADSSKGIAPFFNEGTAGAEIHPEILAAAPDAIVVRKAFADSFFQTTLEAELQRLAATELWICGMMTQNCVTHTAISKSAEKYAVSVLPDCSTTVSEILHLIALNAMSTRVPLVPSTDLL